jgi:hypothetical protein
MTHSINNAWSVLAAALLLLVSRLSAAQLLQASAAASTPCQGEPILVNSSSTYVSFKPGNAYVLGPGTYTMASTVSLAGGQTLCITGSPHASSPSILLPPSVPASNTSSLRLHFLLQGGSLQLTTLRSCRGQERRGWWGAHYAQQQQQQQPPPRH